MNRLAAFMFISLSTSAQAMAPATSEQIICRESSLSAGTIISAESRDCRLSNENSCLDPGKIKLDIEIDRILSPQQDRIYPGEIYSIYVGALPFKPWQGQIEFHPLHNAITDEEARSFIGRKYIFGLHDPEKGDVANQSTAWPIEQEEWVKNIWVGCRKLRPKQ